MTTKRCKRCNKLTSNFSKVWRNVVCKRYGTLVKRRILNNTCKECCYRNKSTKIWFKWSAASKEEKIEHLKRFFERHVIKQDGCWGWNGKLHKSGYTSMMYGKTQTNGHRISYMIHKGSIPEGLLVLHKCDNRSCTNPKHLFLGTHKDNVIDMYNKGRANSQKKNCKCFTKLTDTQVKEIKEKLKLGVTVARIARDCGISNGAIYAIKKGVTWKHVD